MTIRHRVAGVACALLFGIAALPAPSHATEDPAGTAGLVGGFNGNMLCDNGFETEGQTGPDRPNLSGPCWFDIQAEVTTGKPRLTTDVFEDGARSLELCGYPACIEAIGKTITVPYGVTSAILSADFHQSGADSNENGCGSEIDLADFAYVQVSSASDQGGEANYILHCETDPSGWQHVEADVADALNAISGQEATVLVVGMTSDADGAETFHVDNVNLVVTAPGVPRTTYQRELALTLRRHLRASGELTSGPNASLACTEGVTVTIQRRRDGEWVTLEPTAVTGADGTFSVTLPDRQGKYRAVVARQKLDVAHHCAPAVSPAKVHTH